MIKPLRSTLGIIIPQEDQNYVLNPSAEMDGNFSATGGAVVTRSTAFQKYGLYSYEMVVTGGGEDIRLTLLTLPSIDVYVTFRMREPIGDAQFEINLGGVAKKVTLLEKIDSDWRLYGASFPASVAGGETVVEIEKTNVGTGTFYIDGVQVSQIIEGRHYTTYIDGTQEGCRWLGAPHASASTRSGDSRAGGVVTSFWEGFNFFPEKALGLSTAVEEFNIDSYAFLPGGELNSSKIPPREFTIIGYFLADTVEELHEHAQRLELELGLNTYPGRQPVRLRYSGARVLKEISANYTGGLEGDLPIFYNNDWSQEDEAWVKNYKFRMKAPIGFVALDPFWYEVGESATLLDTLDSATFRLVAARTLNPPTWDNLGPPDVAGTYTSVFAIVEDDTYIYIGGRFDNWDNIANADSIVRYNKQTGVYSAMGTGSPATVFALAIMPNGDIIAGGSFGTMGGVANTSRIARWVIATQTWVPLDVGADQSVLALAVGNNGYLYAGGAFTTPESHVMFWDGAAWNAMGAGTGLGDVQALALMLNGDIVAGGDFALMDSVADTLNIAQWDVVNSVWLPLSTGLDDTVYALAVDLSGNLYAGGDFLNPVDRVGLWNGTQWMRLGDSINGPAFCLAVGPDGTLYVGGAFTIAGGITLADRFAEWNGYSWTQSDIDLPGASTVRAIYISRTEIDPIIPDNYALYLGFTTTGTGSYFGLVTSSNQGTISAFPQIVFSRSGGTGATIQTLRNERTGRELLFNYALLDGETLTINLNPKNRSIISSFFGPRMSAILANSDFSTWQLLPGSNPVSSFVSESGSPTVIAYLLWREPYRGWN